MYFISINPFANRIRKHWPARRKRAQHNSKLKEWESKVPSRRCSTQIIQQHPRETCTCWRVVWVFHEHYQHNILIGVKSQNVTFFGNNRIRWAIALEPPRQAFRLTCLTDGEMGFGKLPTSLWEVHMFERKSHKMSDKKKLLTKKRSHFFAPNLSHTTWFPKYHFTSFAFEFGEILEKMRLFSRMDNRQTVDTLRFDCCQKSLINKFEEISREHTVDGSEKNSGKKHQLIR